MCIRLAAPSGGGIGLDSGSVMDAFVTCAESCRKGTRSDAELPEVMIAMPVDERTPGTARQRAERGVRWPGFNRLSRREPLDERAQGDHLAGPRGWRPREQLGRGGGALGPWQDEDHELFQNRKPERALPRRDGQLAKRHLECVREVHDHLRGVQPPPKRRAIRGKAREPLLELRSTGRLKDRLADATILW